MTRLLHARAVYVFARPTWHLGRAEAAAIAWRAFAIAPKVHATVGGERSRQRSEAP